MKRKTVILTSLALILLFAFLKAASIVPVEANPETWTVDDDGPADFHTIQEALEAASPYDTIQVAAGTYNEQVTITKHNLTIIGENPSNTIIDGNGAGWVIFLNTNNVTITGFTVQNGFYGFNMRQSSNCTINGNVITSNQEDGLFVWWESNNNTISNNIMNLNGHHGLRLHDSCSQNKIRGNLLAENDIGMFLSNSRHSALRDNNITGNIYNFGVFGSSPADFFHDIDTSNVVDEKPIYYLIAQNDLIIDSSTFPNLGYLALVNSRNITVRDLDLANNCQGILFANTSNSFITHVTASDNLYGIYLVFSIGNTVSNNLVKPSADAVIGLYLVISKNNTLTRNDLDSCQTGIYLVNNSSNNTVAENTVTNNDRGIYVGVYSSDNIIYHNNFINNTQQATITAYSYCTWDDNYPSGGNFWSDYTGEDLYSGVDQNEPGNDGIGDTPYIIGSGNEDNYPLMNPYMVADLNHDGIVDIDDLAMLGKAYGSRPGDSNWNSDCDSNGDSIVDVFDFVIVGRNYGKTS